MDAALFSSVSSIWRTPPKLFAKLDREFRFAIDASANDENHLCDRWFGPGSALMPCALSSGIAWSYFSPEGAFFSNPPFSRQQGLDIAPWMEAYARHGQYNTVAGLIPARTDTSWWHHYVMSCADEIRLVPGRVKFFLPDGTEGGSAPFPSAVVIWKPLHGRLRVAPRIVAWDYR